MLRVPTEFKKYYINPKNISITGPLGNGGSGVIQKATLNNKTVALKQPNLLTIIKSKSDKNILANEAIILAKLQSPYIVKLIGVTTDSDEFLSIVMQLYKTDLDSFLEKESKTIHFEQQVEWVRDITNALQHVHENGFLHRDLSPRNIFLTQKNKAKLGDFGLCCPQGHLETNSKGTIRYWAPEVFSGAAQSIPSEIFSLGGIFLKIITGSEPFPSLNNIHFSRHINELDFKPPHDAPPLFHLLISACWNRTPKSRPSAQWIVNQCDAVLMLIRAAPTNIISISLKEVVHLNIEKEIQLHSAFSLLEKYLIADERLTFDKSSSLQGDEFKIWQEILDNDKTMNIKYRTTLDVRPLYEGLILSQLTSPYIIKWLGISVEHIDDKWLGVTNQIHTVLEHFTDTLEHFLKVSAEKSQTISSEKILTWCRDICYGLQDIHDKGFMHGYLVLNSIFMVNDTVKIGNFDYAYPQKLSLAERKSDDKESNIPMSAWSTEWFSESNKGLDDIFMLGNMLWRIAFYTSTEWKESIYKKNPSLIVDHIRQPKPIPKDCLFLIKILIYSCWNNDSNQQLSPKKMGDLCNAELKKIQALSLTVNESKLNEIKDAESMRFHKKPLITRSVSSNSFFSQKKHFTVKLTETQMKCNPPEVCLNVFSKTMF